MLKYIYLDKGIPGVEQNNPTELPGTKNQGTLPIHTIYTDSIQFYNYIDKPKPRPYET